MNAQPAGKGHACSTSLLVITRARSSPCPKKGRICSGELLGELLAGVHIWLWLSLHQLFKVRAWHVLHPPSAGAGRGAGRSQGCRNLPWEISFHQGSFCRRRSPTQLCVGLVLGERRSPGSSPGSSVQQERARDEAAALLEDRSTKYHRSTALTCASSPQTKFSVAVGAVCCLPAPRREQAQAFPARLYHSGTLQKSLGCLAWAPGTNYQAC